MEAEIKKIDHSFAWFNATQFLGALNDNIFKLLVVYFLIGTGGAQQATLVQPIAQGLTVVPFLVLLAYAGRLADRHSKRNLIVWCKAAEFLVMLLAALAFWTGFRTALGIVLLLMYTQSAFFTPNKYGIICELVPSDRVIHANGRVQAFTYLAILLGTITAPWVSTIVSGHYVLAAMVCILIAAAGLAFSIAVKTTKSAGGQTQASILFVRDIVRTLWSIRASKGLLWAAVGSAYFSFVGVSMYFCVIPYGMGRLGMTKEKSTYLFVFALVGIALGSLIAGKFSRKRNRNRMIPLGILGLGLCALLLGAIKPTYWPAGGLLFLMGAGAGMFIVPIRAYIQTESPNRQRGEIIAACEFASWVSHLIAILIFLVLTQVIKLAVVHLFVASGLAAALAGVVILLSYKNPYDSTATKKSNSS
ncbi:MAG: MFS transporter [Planctomycetota bacterium]|jgi:acyl-[acyl-carrier-protein]-phospholipid O-acyltransferase/long-chain-fatty-acid--[acyl-carrier-protein] ligase